MNVVESSLYQELYAPKTKAPLVPFNPITSGFYKEIFNVFYNIKNLNKFATNYGFGVDEPINLFIEKLFFF